MRTHHVTNPPIVLRHHSVQLANLALVPASLLLFKVQWQKLANSLPSGDVLIIFPSASPNQKNTLRKVAALLRSKGKTVTTLSSKSFIGE